ncbi:MAG TPA: TonB-dependent siderophore receptor [Azospirillaceae bacterium]|nr:TonB-dependent siderophore receptor [Azospirillaceae bacterium]
MTRPLPARRTRAALALSAAAVALGALPAQAQEAGGAAATQVAALEEIVVTADRVGSFGAGYVQAGTFRNARQIDTPLTVSVVPREVLDAQLATSLHQALRNTAGVTRSQLNGATYDNLAIRGITVENRGNYRLNGSLPIVNLVDLPLENKDRVEVLKGVSALYYGFTSPSGIVNMTAKRPGREPVTEATLSATSHGGVTAHADVGRMSADGTLGARFNAVAGRVETGIDHADGDRALASAAVDWNPTDALSLKLDAEHIRKDVAEPAAIALLPAVNGVIPLPDLPDSERNLAGDWMDYDADATNLLARADWRFTENWAVTLEAGHAHTQRDRAFSQFQNYSLATGEGQLLAFLTRDQDYRNRNLRAEVAGAVATGPVRHSVTVGATHNRRRQNGRVSRQVTFGQNLFDPRPIPETPTPDDIATNPSEIEDQGVYLFERAEIGEWLQLLGGLRYSDYESGTATQRYTATETSPAIGAVLKPLPWVSLYATWIEGLEEGGTAPANVVNANEILPPAISEQWELGVKAEPLERLLLTLARFQVDRPSAFTNAERVFVQDGRTLYDGWEASATGELSAEWSVYASALLLDAEQRRAANPALIGKRPENTPRFSGSVFVEYRPAAVPGLGLSAGTFHVGRRAVNNLNQGFVGGYTTYDLGVRYGFEVAGTRMTARLAVENVTDRRYWNSAGNNLLGVSLPRTAKAAVTARF